VKEFWRKIMKGNPISDYVEVVVNPYASLSPKNRKGIMVGGPWAKEITEFIKDNDIRAVYLNISRGWKGSDYSFLAELTTIEELNIITSDAHNVSSIESMSSLKDLSLTCSTKEKVDFSKLKNLEKCFLYWWPGASGIFECVSLKCLYIDEAKLKDYSPLGALKNLQSLTIGNSPVKSISWLSELNDLTELTMLNIRTLNDFSPIEYCKQLKRLTIRGSKSLADLGFMSSLSKLEFISISDNSEINSLKPLSGLNNLKALSFAGSSIIKDGDLSILETFPKLSMLMFQGRRNYSHKLIKKWDWKNFDNPDTLLQKK